MEIQRAIEIIERKSSIPNDDETFEEICEAYDLAVEALEKQIPKKVNLYVGNDAVCPSCNKRLRGYEGMKIAYCKFCGQLIKGEGVIDD